MNTWAAVTTILAGFIAALTFISALFARYIASNITASIDRFRIEVVEKLDRRLTVVETILSLKNRRDG